MDAMEGNARSAAAQPMDEESKADEYMFSLCSEVYGADSSNDPDPVDLNEVVVPLNDHKDSRCGCSCSPVLVDEVLNGPRFVLDDWVRGKKTKRVRFSPDVKLTPLHRIRTEDILVSESPLYLSNPCTGKGVLDSSNNPCSVKGILDSRNTCSSISEPRYYPSRDDVSECNTHTKDEQRKPSSRKNNSDRHRKRRNYILSKDYEPIWSRIYRTRLILVTVASFLILTVSISVLLMRSKSPPAQSTTAIPTAASSTDTIHSGVVSNETWLISADSSDGALYNEIKGKCFETNQELQNAVDLFFNAEETSLKQLATTYGWPMNSWCTSNVTNMTRLFSIARNPFAAQFNENITAWDVSKVLDLSYFLEGASLFDHDLSSWIVEQAQIFDSMLLNVSLYNHSLCSWGRSLQPGASVKDMFLGTGCLDTKDPNLKRKPPSPFCISC